MALVIAGSAFAGPARHGLTDQRTLATNASIIVGPSKSYREHSGDVQVTFRDGHTEVLTHGGGCSATKVSSTGNVGWVQGTKLEELSGGKIHALGRDALVVRLPNGTTKKFPPVSDNPFIEDWKFGEHDQTVVLRSHGYHGPSLYAEYDLASGKKIDSREGYTPNAELPAWAKPVADPTD